MKDRKEVEGFSPWDIDQLQECFDSILTAQRLAKGSEEAENMSSALIAAYQRGVRNRGELIRVVSTFQ
jgi:hypothetical protein